MKTSQECSSQSLAFKCIEFCSTLSNQGLRYAFSLKIGNFNFSLKSDNNSKKRSRPPSYIRRQKLRRELQKKNTAQGMAKETKPELLKKNSVPDTNKENMTSVNNTDEQDKHIIKPTPYAPDETMETDVSNTEDKDTQNEKDTHTQTIPKAPVKPTLYEPERDPNELTITIRKGKDPTDAPAAGTRTFNLMSDPVQVSRVIDHFNIMDKATRITKPTLTIPTLQVRLRETFAKLMADGLINTNPVKIQKASKGKIELWAHLPTEWNH